jgi:transposase
MDGCEIAESGEVHASALEGDYRAEHLFALKQSLELFDTYKKQIASCHEQIEQHLRSLATEADSAELKAARKVKKKRRNQPEFSIREQAFRISGVDLTQIHGIDETAALSLIAEIGVDMNAWKTEKHFSSWLALRPNNKISGGKILRRSTRKSANRAREFLQLCAKFVEQSERTRRLLSTDMWTFRKAERHRCGSSQTSCPGIPHAEVWTPVHGYRSRTI